MRILAIESSCDETAAAVIEDGTKILSNVIASSTAMHAKYGGIFPEVAAREQLRCIIPTIQEALAPLIGQQPSSSINHPPIGPLRRIEASEASQLSIINSIDAIAVTVGPGLIGSLLIGVETAKSIAFVTKKPLIPVNHVLAHMYANFVDGSEFSVQRKSNTHDSELRTPNSEPITFPAISLVVSGGHTELFLMESEKKLTWLGGTIDDAAGEAFDKTARLLGFENRGGPAIQEAASKCHPGLDPGSSPEIDSDLPAGKAGSEAGMTKIIKLPRPMLHDETLNFSFSGLKTAVNRMWKTSLAGLDPGSHPEIDSGLPAGKAGSEAGMTNMFAHEVQESITDVLVIKTLRAVKQYNARSILLSGGVAANLRLREKFKLSIINSQLSITLHVPPVPLCTDNAVYIGAYAYFRGKPVDWHHVTAIPDMSVEDIEI